MDSTMDNQQETNKIITLNSYISLNLYNLSYKKETKK